MAQLSHFSLGDAAGKSPGASTWNMSWPEIVLLVLIIAVTAGAVIVWRKRE